MPHVLCQQGTADRNETPPHPRPAGRSPDTDAATRRQDVEPQDSRRGR